MRVEKVTPLYGIVPLWPFQPETGHNLARVRRQRRVGLRAGQGRRTQCSASSAPRSATASSRRRDKPVVREGRSRRRQDVRRPARHDLDRGGHGQPAQHAARDGRDGRADRLRRGVRAEARSQINRDKLGDAAAHRRLQRQPVRGRSRRRPGLAVCADGQRLRRRADGVVPGRQEARHDRAWSASAIDGRIWLLLLRRPAAQVPERRAAALSTGATCPPRSTARLRWPCRRTATGCTWPIPATPGSSRRRRTASSCASSRRAKATCCATSGTCTSTRPRATFYILTGDQLYKASVPQPGATQ